MVETLGSVVNTLAKEDANTNDTIKQMMIQQTTTMNNFMLLMARNEERRQEVPIREIQQAYTPTNSTITNSQFSLSQHSTSANKRKIDGIADDETTAASTLAVGTDQSTDEDNIDAMLEEQSDALEEISKEQEEDVTMVDNELTTTNKQQQQQAITTNNNATVLAAGDFEQQFSMKKRTDKKGNSAPTGANSQ
jgi:transcriptional regulator with PAS, ATPase and Fis domain